MEQICINEECEFQVNEFFPIIAYHEDHKEDIITKDYALNIITDRTVKIKQTIDYLQDQLNKIEKVKLMVIKNEELLQNERITLKYFKTNLFLSDQNKQEINFRSTKLNQTENIQQQSNSQFKNFTAKYNLLFDNLDIWNKIKCLNHNNKIHSLILVPNCRGSRILCQNDNIQKGILLSKCVKFLQEYHEQEKALEGMIRLKEQLCHLRIKFDNFTSRTINWLTSIIQDQYQTFKSKQDYFTKYIQLEQHSISLNLQKIEHVAQVLSIMTKDDEIIQLITKEQIQNFQSLQATINQIDNLLKLQLDANQANIYLYVEIIYQNNPEVKGYYLLTPNIIQLFDLFEWAKMNNLIQKDHQMTDVNVYINFNNYNSKGELSEDLNIFYQYYEFKNDDLIQFEL